MYELLQKGVLGNTLVVSDSASKFFTPRHYTDIWWGVRSKRINDPVRLYKVPPSETEEKIQFLRDKGYDLERDLTYTEIIPNQQEVTRIQGEISQAPELYFRYTWSREPMRVAFEQDEHSAWGLQALNLLKAHCHASTLDEFEYIFERFPGCTIEFASYDFNVGIHNLPHVIWEVRHY